MHKEQAARIRSALIDSGIDVSVELSLELLASAHAARDWHSLRLLPRLPMLRGQALTTALDRRLRQAGYAPDADALSRAVRASQDSRPDAGSTLVVIGHSGPGKTLALLEQIPRKELAELITTDQPAGPTATFVDLDQRLVDRRLAGSGTGTGALSFPPADLRPETDGFEFVHLIPGFSGKTMLIARLIAAQSGRLAQTREQRNPERSADRDRTRPVRRSRDERGRWMPLGGVVFPSGRLHQEARTASPVNLLLGNAAPLQSAVTDDTLEHFRRWKAGKRRSLEGAAIQ